ncbi:MAG: hypothetical protein H0W04_04940 [Chthoniobacterales bacterium]|nr:hypothetical protein [Chthoniobacterales bacterium]
MKRVACFLLLLALASSGCGSFRKKSKTSPAQTKTKEQATPGEENPDQDFAAFVGRLRKVVRARDAHALAEMMTQDFAYVMGGTPETDRKGDGVFQFWEEHGLWPELEGIVNEKFVKKDDFMVAPPQFADPAVEYEGYRAGVRRVNGSWKFVYFVGGEAKVESLQLRGENLP